MASRRGFLGLVALLSSAAGLPAALRPAIGQDLGLPSEDAPHTLDWIPSREEVSEWLDFYRESTRAEAKRLHERLLGLTYQAIEGALLEVERPNEFVARFEKADAALEAAQPKRVAVGSAHGAGYEVGRRGGERVFVGCQPVSNESYSWYNGWSVGRADYEWAKRKEERRSAGDSPNV